MMRLMGHMAEREPWWAEYWSACSAISWALWAMLLTEGLSDLDSFRIVTYAIPGWVSCTLGLCAGLIQVYALRQDKVSIRWWMCLLMAGWWTWIFLGLVQGTPSTPGMAFYVVNALVNYYSVYRLRG